MINDKLLQNRSHYKPTDQTICICAIPWLVSSLPVRVY